MQLLFCQDQSFRHDLESCKIQKKSNAKPLRYGRAKAAFHTKRPAKQTVDAYAKHQDTDTENYLHVTLPSCFYYDI
jgi:hypothetical protein